MNESSGDIYHDLVPESALEFATAATGEVKSSDVAYLCDYVYPFLQIASSDYILADLTPQVITAPNGWRILDYGEILSVAVPHEQNIAGHGTIVQQQFDIAFAVIEIAKQKGWGNETGDEGGEGELKPVAAQILGGTPMMRRFAGFAAKILGIKLDGFEPTAEDLKWMEKLYERYMIREKLEVRAQTT